MKIYTHETNSIIPENALIYFVNFGSTGTSDPLNISMIWGWQLIVRTRVYGDYFLIEGIPDDNLINETIEILVEQIKHSLKEVVKGE